jgi:hypothetical protein
MSQRYPNLSKRQVYYFMSKIPLQSRRVYDAVKRIVDPMPETHFDFSELMNTLFFSKDILMRTGYFHLKTLTDKNQNYK